MVDIRGPDWEKIKEEYIKLNGNVKLKEFAEKHGVKYSTLRSRKNRENWDNDINKNVATKTATQQKNVATKNKNKNNDKEPVVQEVKEVLENTELTDKQRLFCVLYVKYMNATKAYLKSYKCTYETAMVNGPRLLGNARVREQVDKLIGAKCNKEFLSRSIIQKYIDIAFSDMGDYVQFGKKYKGMWTKNDDGEDIPVIDPETGQQKIIEYNYLDLKESSLVDTTLINEISEGKDGIKFKLADKMKALDFLTKHCNLLSDEEKTKLDIENKRLQNIKLRVETEKIKGKDKDEPIEILIKRKDKD